MVRPMGKVKYLNSSSVVAISASTPPPKSNLEDFVFAGAFAGALARVVSAPFDLLKIRFQLQTGVGNAAKYRGIWQAARKIVKEEGLVSLWNGNLSATYLWVTYSMVQFGVYGYLKEWAEGLEQARLTSLGGASGRTDPFVSGGSNGKVAGAGAGAGAGGHTLSSNNDKTQEQEDSLLQAAGSNQNSFRRTFALFLCGAGAAILASTLTYPFDIMRTQFTIQGNTKIYPSIYSFVSTTMQKQGPRGFYAGLGPTLVGITPYIGLNFALYDTVKSFMDNSDREQTLAQGGGGGRQGSHHPFVTAVKKSVAGGFAGGASKLLVYPLDTVKRRMQASVLQSTLDGAVAQAAMPKYRNMVHCVQLTVASEGMVGLYRGIVPSLLKSCVSTAVTFAAYEQGLLLAQRLKLGYSSRSGGED